MKRITVAIFVMLFSALQMNAQKIGYIDTEKILKAIPAYTSAQNQLESLSEKYRKEIEAEYAVIETMYNNYQSQKQYLSAQARQQKENEIINREQAVKQLQNRYFGQDGNMQKKSGELLDPIKAKVDEAVKKVAAEGGYMLLLDVAVLQGVAFRNEAYDLSAKVIANLGN